MKKTFSDRKKVLPGFQWNLVQVVGALCVFVGIAVLIFMQSYSIYTDGILYEERLGQMQEVTEQLFAGLEEVVNDQWYNAELQENFLLDEQPSTASELVRFLQKQTTLSSLEKLKTDLVVVDNRGRYYTQDGSQGLLNGMEYLMDSPERISFISSATTRERTQMMFLLRLEKPVTIQDGNHTVDLTYCGVARDMTELNQFFSCQAYSGENAVYVLDENGTKLFSGENGSDFIDSFNAYTALRNMTYLHGRSFDDTLSELKQNRIAYSNAVVGSRECYYSLYQMGNSAWVILFMVPSDRVAVSTVNLVDTTTKLVLGFAVCLVVISGICIYWLIHRQQKEALLIAERNNRILKENNQKLLEAQEVTKEALQTAETASRAKTDFLSNMSHDIRTPMNAIVGLTGLMESSLHNPEKLQEYLVKLKSSSQHLLNLINEILDMNKIESGKSTLNDVSFTLAEQVLQLESIIRPQSRESGQEFTIETHQIRHEYLKGDATRLQQVLQNILSNSVKYTNRGGHILLDIEEMPRNGHYARYRFRITDDGIGMSEEFQKHIYESFTREESSVTNKVQGTGLGMAITKSIVDMMGGSISLTSELGKGSCFEVILEFRIDEQAETAAEENLRLMLLYISDEDLTRVRNATENYPVAVTCAASPQETKKLLLRESFDVILVPYQRFGANLKPEMERIRALAGEKTILLGVAASQNEEELEKLYESGLDGFIPLPFFFSNLKAELKRIQSQKGSGRQEDAVLKGMHLLCAEDNALNAEILQGMLEMKGASCTICRDGAEIVKFFRNVKPGDYDAILMDVQMPVMNGYEATHAIREGENPLGRTIPIIAMTANAFSEDVQKSYEAGMDSHLSKPVDFKALEETLRRFRVTPPPQA